MKKSMIFTYLLCVLLCASALFSAEGGGQRAHIPYLAQRGEVAKALQAYRAFRQECGRDDFEVLGQVGKILLEKGALSEQSQSQLLALYGSAYASLSSTLSILEVAIKSRHLETQLAAVHMMARIDDDRCHSLLNQAMNSNFLYTRMEAAQQLCLRKDPRVVGQIEALMHRVPPELKAYFPPLFGMIGSHDGTKILKSLLNDADENVRIEAILSAARSHREDLLPILRKMATHQSPREQEACAYALGMLDDTHSISHLKKLESSALKEVQIAATRALYQLKVSDAASSLKEWAKQGNLFAINALEDVAESEEALADLLQHSSPHVRLGSTLSLLKKRDPRVAESVIALLRRDARDIGFYQASTPGRTLSAWKVLASLKQHQKKGEADLVGMTLSLRENILKECIELPEETFLHIAESLFASQQFDLIPLLVRLLENVDSKEAVDLLQKESQISSALLIRAYCNLALFRLGEKGPFAEHVYQWAKSNQGKELIQFKEVDLKKAHYTHTSFELTPQEHSRLLIETCEALAQHKDEKSIDVLIHLLETGNPNNQYLLSGLLLKALQ